MKKIGVLDYGSGNIHSLAMAVRKIGRDVDLITSPEQMWQVDNIILPGVGAFGRVMQKLKDKGFSDELIAIIRAKKPVLGICVGMQVLFEFSYEFGKQEGLGCLEGSVDEIPRYDINGNLNRIPHVGWSDLIYQREDEAVEGIGELFCSVNNYESFYFIHSFSVSPANSSISVAHTIYGGHVLTAAVRQGMLFGTQFHPEKSGSVGLKVLENFTCF